MNSFTFDKERRIATRCPCGKSNKDGKFAPFQGFTDKGYCFSCSKTFYPNKMDTKPRTLVKYPFEVRASESKEEKTGFVTEEAFRGHLSDNISARNYFEKYLSGLFGGGITKDLKRRFFISASSHWDGATVFWQIDGKRNIRTGKIMLYDPKTGKRVKQPQTYIGWVHKELGIDKVDQCLFGEHQLVYEQPNKPIAIVESEKTAIIASVYLPNYIWMAAGGVAGLTSSKLRLLKGRNIILYPDLGKYQIWVEKAKEIRSVVGCKIEVAHFLDDLATESEKEQGLDLADYLVELDSEMGWALTEERYPVFWDFKK